MKRKMKTRYLCLLLSVALAIGFSFPVAAQNVNTDIKAVQEIIQSAEPTTADEIVVDSFEFYIDDEYSDLLDNTQLVLIADEYPAMVEEGESVEMTLYLEGSTTNSSGAGISPYATIKIPIAFVTVVISGGYYKYLIVPVFNFSSFNGTSCVYNRSGMSQGTVKHTSLSGSRKYYSGGFMRLSGTISCPIGSAYFMNVFR